MHYVLVVDVRRTCLGVFVMIICGMCCQLTRAVDSDDNVVYGCDSGGCLLRHSTANTTQHTDTTANPAVTVRPISSDDRELGVECCGVEVVVEIVVGSVVLYLQVAFIGIETQLHKCTPAL